MRKYAAISAVILAMALIAVPTIVRAGQPQMEAEPNTGPEGTNFDVHNQEGSPCFNGNISVSVSGGPEGSPFNGVGGEDSTFKQKSGDWNVPLTVPEDSTPGQYTINATCQQQQVQVVGGQGFQYQAVNFIVTGQTPSPTPTPTPTPDPDPDPTPTPDDDVDDNREDAPAAEPEVQAAAFTG
jgi:hypothetical protein